MAAAAVAKLLTLDEVAQMLRKTPASLRWMIHVGTAPASALIGNRRMFRESDVEAYINAAFDGAAR
nr:helix-turn-helix domain-containing protein [Arthrobacter sp. PAMC 25486]